MLVWTNELLRAMLVAIDFTETITEKPLQKFAPGSKEGAHHKCN